MGTVDEERWASSSEPEVWPQRLLLDDEESAHFVTTTRPLLSPPLPLQATSAMSRAQSSPPSLTEPTTLHHARTLKRLSAARSTRSSSDSTDTHEPKSFLKIKSLSPKMYNLDFLPSSAPLKTP